MLLLRKLINARDRFKDGKVLALIKSFEDGAGCDVETPSGVVVAECIDGIPDVCRCNVFDIHVPDAKFLDVANESLLVGVLVRARLDELFNVL